MLIIGYGFGDRHINEIISNGIEQYGLKLYIISPEPIGSFNEKLKEKYLGTNILKGISGYFPYTLFQIFPVGTPVTQAQRNLWENFFEIEVT